MDEFKRYDFTSPEKITRDHLRTLEIVHDSFTREIERILIAQMGVRVTVRIRETESVFYRDYVKRSGSAIYGVFSLPPLPGAGIIEIDSSLADEIIDRSLGGHGPSKHSTERRSISLIDRTIFERTLGRILRGYTEAWQRIIQLDDPKILNIEVDQGLLRVTNANDVGAFISMEVEINDIHGEWVFYLPSLMLENVLGRLTQNRILFFNQEVDEAVEEQFISDVLSDLPLTLSVKLNPHLATEEEVDAIRDGDVIMLPHSLDSPVLLKIDDRTIARAFLGKTEGRLAVKIKEFVDDAKS